MMGRTALASLLVAGLVVSAIAGAVAVYYAPIGKSTSTVTATVTVTSLNTIVQLVTKVSPESVPSSIMVNGTIQSESNLPVAIDFCSYTSENFSPTNESVEANPSGGILCGTHTTPVHITGQTLEKFGDENLTYFDGTYSAQLPNNATYLLQVRLLQSGSGPSFEEEAGWLPLNYTSSARIVGYGIACFELQENGSNAFQCSSGFA
jgi:hypothetical protein